MKLLALIMAVTMMPYLAFNQISKGDFLLGGTLRVGYTNIETSFFNDKSFEIGLFPSGGYFIADKLAVGASLSFNFTYDIEREISSQGLQAGPQVRYYLLNKENKINVFTQASYRFGWDSFTDSALHDILIGAGPVFFINKNIALETGLYFINNKYTNLDAQFFFAGAGFQIHFDRSNQKKE
jgi:hypothetical protein